MEREQRKEEALCTRTYPPTAKEAGAEEASREGRSNRKRYRRKKRKASGRISRRTERWNFLKEETPPKKTKKIKRR